MLEILIVVLGMIFGFYLREIAEEEIIKGKKYFLISEKILLAILIIVILFFIKLNILLLIGLVIGLIICRFFKQIYFYFGILTLSGFFVNKELLLIIISLVFLFSLIYNSLNKFKLRSFLVNIILFLIPFSLLFVESFINSNLDILIGLGIGGVIMWALSSAW